MTGLRRVFAGARSFFFAYLPNHVINAIPVYALRHGYYRTVVGLEIAPGASIHMRTTVQGRHIEIGANTIVNRSCHLDGRGGLRIGESVSVSPHVQLITASHDANSRSFDYTEAPIVIKKHVWIGTRATVLPGVTLGEGCVVATGAVVARDVAPFTIVGGIPAKPIGVRRSDLDYDCGWSPPFD